MGVAEVERIEGVGPSGTQGKRGVMNCYGCGNVWKSGERPSVVSSLGGAPGSV
jgi:hypothetical protein